MQLDFVLGTRHSSQSAQCRGRETLRREAGVRGSKRKERNGKETGKGRGIISRGLIGSFTSFQIMWIPVFN